MADIEAIDVTLIKPSLNLLCDCLWAPSDKRTSATYPLVPKPRVPHALAGSFPLEFQSFDVSRTSTFIQRVFQLCWEFLISGNLAMSTPDVPHSGASPTLWNDVFAMVDQFVVLRCQYTCELTEQRI